MLNNGEKFKFSQFLYRTYEIFVTKSEKNLHFSNSFNGQAGRLTAYFAHRAKQQKHKWRFPSWPHSHMASYKANTIHNPQGKQGSTERTTTADQGRTKTVFAQSSGNNSASTAAAVADKECKRRSKPIDSFFVSTPPLCCSTHHLLPFCLRFPTRQMTAKIVSLLFPCGRNQTNEFVKLLGTFLNALHFLISDILDFDQGSVNVNKIFIQIAEFEKRDITQTDRQTCNYILRIFCYMRGTICLFLHLDPYFQ